MSQPYFDPLGETEPHTTRYKLFVRYQPLHPLNPYARLSAPEPITTLFDTRWKILTLKSTYIPPFARCRHLQAGAHECRTGCYTHEKSRRGGWRCASAGCEGHRWVWKGDVV